MRILLNILWFIFGGGFLIWLSYVLVGVLLCISIIGIPFGIQDRNKRASLVERYDSEMARRKTAPRSLSTRMRQWVHEISEGAPPRSLGSWLG